MTWIEYIPRLTPDGRHVVFEATPVSSAERVKRALRRLRAALSG
jgi:hypothetical protein